MEKASGIPKYDIFMPNEKMFNKGTQNWNMLLKKAKLTTCKWEY